MLTVVSTLLTLRFVLKLFGANQSNTFVRWAYESSAEILGPFRGIFPAPNLDGFVIEFSTLFALVIYGIVGMIVLYFIDTLTPEDDIDPTSTEISATSKRRIK